MKLEEWHSEINEQRIPHQIKLQSHQIEKTFSGKNLAAQVMGGNISRQTIRFDLAGQFEAGKELLFGIKDELLSMFGVSSIHFSRSTGGLQLHIDRLDENAVTLVNILRNLDEINPCTAILGLDDEGHPLLHEFCGDSLSHMLIQGGAHSGKSTLLRTIGVSLAMTNKQSRLQLVAITPNKNKENILKPLDYLPHMLEPVVDNVEDCTELLTFLEEETQYRLNQECSTPTIVVLFDDVQYFLNEPKIVNQLANLLQRGPAAGVHMVLANGVDATRPFPEMLKANIPFQIIGQVDSNEEAQLVTNLVDSEAEFLEGKGEFLILTGETSYAFQAANISNYELHLVVDKLHRSRPRSILAQTFQTSREPDIVPLVPVEEESEPIPFKVSEGYQVSIGKPRATVTTFDEDDDVEEFDDEDDEVETFDDDAEYLEEDDEDDFVEEDDDIPFDIGSPPDGTR